MKSIFAFSSLVVAGILSAQPARAANYYWDIDGVTAGAGGASPSGTWATSGTTWSPSPNGNVATPAYTTVPGDDLFFSAGTNATGTFTIGLTDAQPAGSLTFQEGNGTISGTGGVVTLGGAGGKITVNNGATAVVGAATDSIIGGSVGMTKLGIGTLTLNGSLANTFTGGVKVNGGTLALNFANLATPTDLISNGNSLSLGGGRLSITGKSTDNTSQTLGDVTVNSGGGSILGNKNGGTATSIILGTLTTTASGGNLLVGAGGTAANIPTITTTSGTLTNGIYSGRAVYFNGPANTGYDWLTNAGGAGPDYTLSGLGAGSYTALDLTAGLDSNNSTISATATTTGSRETNSLKFSAPATAQTLTNTGFTLTLTGGGLLFTGTSVAQGPRIAGGEITAGNGSGSYDLVLHNYNATAQNIGVGITGANMALVTTISSNIVNNGANPVTVVKSGPGSLVLSGANTFTGGIIVNEGNLAFNLIGALNNNPITFNANSIVHTFGGSTTSGQITLNNNSQVTILNNNSSFTVTGKVTGTGGISIGQGGQGSITLNLNAPDNDFTGPIRYVHTQFNQSAHMNVVSLVDTTAVGEGNITLGAAAGASQGTNSHNFNYAAAAAADLTLNNRRFELASTQIMQSINNVSSRALTINTDLLTTGTSFKTLTLGGAGTGNSTFAGLISQGSSTLYITKGGTGTWNLTAANTHTGATRVAAGTLNVNSLSIGGLPSSIGQSSSVAANLVLSGGTLRYAPISAVGGGSTATDRNFTITASSAIDASSSGPLIFMNTGVISPEPAALTGTWTNTNVNLITGLSSTANLTAGMRVTGAGIAANTTIVAITSATSVSLSATPTTAATTPTSVSFGTPTTRTLTLTGTNTDDNTIAGTLQDASAVGVGTLGITKSGAGTWSLAGNNTYSGPTTLSGGTLSVRSVDNLGAATSNLVFNGGALRITWTDLTNFSTIGHTVIFNANKNVLLDIADPNNVFTVDQPMNQGAGVFEKFGPGTVILNQDNSFIPSGAERSTVHEGILLATKFTSLPGVTSDDWSVLANATLAVRVLETSPEGEWTSANLDSLLGGDGATEAFDTNSILGIEVTGANNFTYANDIAGTSVNPAGATKGLTKLGSGTLTLTGANTYTGATKVSSGTLALVGGSHKSPITLSSGASLEFALGSPTTSTSTFNLSAGTIKISGSPTLASYTLISASTGITGTPTLAVAVPGYALQVDGNALKLVQTAGNTYATWIAGFPAVGLLTGFTDDADGDGIKNGVENYLGTNPTSPTRGLVVGSLAGNTLTFTHLQNATPASDVTASYIWSKDLATFNASGVTDGAGTTVTFTAQPNTPVSGTTTVTATITGTATAKLFVNLKVTKN